MCIRDSYKTEQHYNKIIIDRRAFFFTGMWSVICYCIVVTEVKEKKITRSSKTEADNLGEPIFFFFLTTGTYNNK